MLRMFDRVGFAEGGQQLFEVFTRFSFLVKLIF
uniref:Uncharacterized protein n=1 Tax=Arundo donax TaxID=35708 RepID=A0A0A9C6T5_ARUDO